MLSLENVEPRSSEIIRYVETQEDFVVERKCDCQADCRCVSKTCHCQELRALASSRDRVLGAYELATSELKVAARNAVNQGMMKIEVARQANVTRPTLDAWLSQRGQ